MELIRNYFKTEFNMDEEDWEIFLSKLKKGSFSKKHILLRKGEVENYLSFMEKEIVRFSIPKLNNDLTFDFAFENQFFSGCSSFLTQSPSIYQIETLTETTLWQISYNDLQFAYSNTKTGDKIGRISSEALFLRKSKREISLLNETLLFSFNPQ